MSTIEERLAQGVEEGKIPHAVVCATNGDGSFTYTHAVGTSSGTSAIKDDAVFLLASQTKLLTSIAALQVVEAGLIGLDDDVAGTLPELGGQKILKGFGEDGKPILEERKERMTLRHLLTHSSGLGYEAVDPGLMEVARQAGKKAGTGATVQERCTHPLLFEPGSAWMYGSSIDWAGKLVERITGMTLEEYMRENIFVPLGVNTLTFWPYANPELAGRVPQLMTRNAEGKLVEMKGTFINTTSTDCFGGHGAYGVMRDYLEVQRSLLADDQRLLKKETVAMLFQPQLTAEAKASLNYYIKKHPLGEFMVGEYNPDVELDWGLGGIIFLQDDVGKRKRGTLNWGGMANCFWIIDREADLAYTFGTQVLPPGDVPAKQMISAFELGLYERAGVKV